MREHAICSISVSIDAFRFLILDCEKANVTPSNPNGRKKNSHFFLCFVVRLFIHLQFRQRTAATHHCINGNRIEKGRGYTEFGKIFSVASLNYNVRIKWKRFAGKCDGDDGQDGNEDNERRWQPPSEKGKTIKYFPRLFIFIIIRESESSTSTSGKRKQCEKAS